MMSCKPTLIQYNKKTFFYLTIISIIISIILPAYYFTLNMLNNRLMEEGNLKWWLINNATFTFIGCFLIMLCNIRSVNFLHRYFPWSESRNFGTRAFLEFFFSVAYTATISFFVSVFAKDILDRYSEFHRDTFVSDVFQTIVIANSINLITLATFEGIFLLKQWRKTIIESERFQKEHILSQYETLKNQINPHFLFNSLNALTNIIMQDQKKAVEFVNEFSKVYRNILNLKDQILIPLSEELDLVNSYIYLHKIRYRDNLKIDIHIDAAKLKYLIPPLSLQLLIENAIKHNIISKDDPLSISIQNEGDILIIKNNLQTRNNNHNSTGIGLKNLESRYEMVSVMKPVFYIKDESYIAKIPLLEGE